MIVCPGTAGGCTESDPSLATSDEGWKIDGGCQHRTGWPLCDIALCCEYSELIGGAVIIYPDGVAESVFQIPTGSVSCDMGRNNAVGKDADMICVWIACALLIINFHGDA